jgi:short-subunit dehydrogenase
MVGGKHLYRRKAAATSVIMSLANEVKGTGVYVFCLTPAGVGRFDPSKMPKPVDGKPLPDF